MIESQEKQIRKHLESGKTLTPMDALRLFGCFRLGARIYDLTKTGMRIEKNMVKRGRSRVAEYYAIR